MDKWKQELLFKLDKLEEHMLAIDLIIDDINKNCNVDRPDFFSKMIGNGSYLPELIQNRMGVLFDFCALSVWDERHIRWQAAAQVGWFNKPVATIKVVQEEMLKNDRLYELLDLKILTSVARPESRGRGLADVIGVVNPIRKKGRRSKSLLGSLNTQIVPIPAVYNPETVRFNGRALKLATVTIAQVLFLGGKSVRDIMCHPVVGKYKELTSSILGKVIDWWIAESLENGRVF